MMRRLLMATVLAGLLAVGVAPWLRAAQTSTVYGHGTATCGTWTADKRDASNKYIVFANQAWVLGWVSAAGYYRPLAMAASDTEGLTAYIDKYCAEHPLDPVSDASIALVNELVRRGKR